MNREQKDKFVKQELERTRHAYEKGVAMKCPMGMVLGRKCPPGKEKESNEVFSEENPAGIMLCMMDLDDNKARALVKKIAFETDAFAVSVSMECWYAAVSHSLPAEERARQIAEIEAAKKKGGLQHLSPPLRKDMVQVFVETESFPVQLFKAEITWEGDPETSKAILGPWEERPINLPRPNFKRYLPEMRNGKRTLVLDQTMVVDMASSMGIPGDMMRSFMRAPMN